MGKWASSRLREVSLSLLSAAPAVTFPVAEHRRPFARWHRHVCAWLYLSSFVVGGGKSFGFRQDHATVVYEHLVEGCSLWQRQTITSYSYEPKLFWMNCVVDMLCYTLLQCWRLHPVGGGGSTGGWLKSNPWTWLSISVGGVMHFRQGGRTPWPSPACTALRLCDRLAECGWESNSRPANHESAALTV